MPDFAIIAADEIMSASVNYKKMLIKQLLQGPVTDVVMYNTDGTASDETTAEQDEAFRALFEKNGLRVHNIPVHATKDEGESDRLDQIAADLGKQYPGQVLKLFVFAEKEHRAIKSAKEKQNSGNYKDTFFFPVEVDIEKDRPNTYFGAIQKHEDGYQNVYSYKERTQLRGIFLQKLDQEINRDEYDKNYAFQRARLVARTGESAHLTLQEADITGVWKGKSDSERSGTLDEELMNDAVATFIPSGVADKLTPREKCVLLSCVYEAANRAYYEYHDYYYTYDASLKDLFSQEEIGRSNWKIQLSQVVLETLQWYLTPFLQTDKPTGFATENSYEPSVDLSNAIKRAVLQSDIQQYIDDREREFRESGNTYNSVFGRLFGDSAGLKFSVARKVLALLAGKDDVVLLPDEHRALSRGRLGALLKQHPHFKVPSPYHTQTDGVTVASKEQLAQAYIDLRTSERKYGPEHGYNSTSGRLFGTPADVKLSAVGKFRDGNDGDMTPAEHKALKGGRLSDIVKCVSVR